MDLAEPPELPGRVVRMGLVLVAVVLAPAVLLVVPSLVGGLLAYLGVWWPLRVVIAAPVVVSLYVGAYELMLSF